jgi:hypothetical protein
MKRTRTGFALAAGTALAIGGAFAGVGAPPGGGAVLARAAAAPADAGQAVSLTLKYQCSYPLIGKQPLSVKIDAEIPKTFPSGEGTPKFAIQAVATVNAGATRGLRAVYGETLEGDAHATATVTSPDHPDGSPLDVGLALDKTAIPESGEFPVNVHGNAPSLTFTKAGHGTIAVGDLVLSLSTKLKDGGESGLGPFESECTQDPGQNNVLAEFDVVGKEEPAAVFKLKGSTRVKAAGVTVPLTGALTTGFDAAGKLTGTLALDKSAVPFKLFGFLPASFDVAFGPAVQTTGTLSAAKLTTTSAVPVSVPSVKVFGLEIGGGPDCRTATPAQIGLASDPFDKASGGKLTGTYTLPKLQDCGMLTSILSAVAAGPGNTISLTAAP